MAVQAVRLAWSVLDRNEAILLGALAGLTAEELCWRPDPDCNPMGWLMWHLTRVQDNHLAAMRGEEHAWVTERWYERFGRSADPADRGRGHTSEQVAAFRAPDVETLVDYYRAVRAHADAFLDGLSEEQLERPVPNLSGDGTVPMRVRLEMALVDSLQHSGQIAYLRGLLKGRGWYPN